MAFWIFGLLPEFSSSSFSSLIFYFSFAHYFSMIFSFPPVGVYEAAMFSSRCEYRDYREKTEAPAFLQIFYILTASSGYLFSLRLFFSFITLIPARKAFLPIARVLLPR